MANKNGFPTWLGIILIILVAIGVYYYIVIAEPKEPGTEITVVEVTGDFAEEGGYVDGIWDPDTKECLPPPGREGMVLARCCFKKLSDGTEKNVPCSEVIIQQSFWINTKLYTDDAGLAYGISFRNTGTDKIDEAWVSNVFYAGKDADNNPVTTPTEITTGFNVLKGKPHVGPIIPGADNVQYGTTSIMYFGTIATSDERFYTTTMQASYTAAGGKDSGSSQGGLTLAIRKASYGLAITICGDGACDPGETSINCPEDCT